MNKIAKDFFDIGYVCINHLDDFFESDLFVYLKCLYRKEPVLSSSGFIKIVKKGQLLYLYQHLYYDQTPGIDGDFYISLEGLNIQNSEIVNSEIGHRLLHKGFASIEVSDSFKTKCIKQYPALNYKSGPENESLDEPIGTFKLNSEIWSDSYFTEIQKSDIELKNQMFIEFQRIISFSGVLQSLDLFDVNFLKWTKGRSMKAHNGVDYRSFVNFISYNSEDTVNGRDLECGNFDWYDITFNSVLQNEFTPLMNINNKNQIIKRIKAESSTLIIVNSFNPRFYHKVLELVDEDSVLFTSTANMSFSHIVNDISFQW